MVSQSRGVFLGGYSKHNFFLLCDFIKKMLRNSFCVLIYIFCLLFHPFFSRGASSNYFFVRRSSLLPHWCWSLWCWFSFKIKSSDLKNPPWLSCATQIVAEILFLLSQTFQNEISFWMKKNAWWKKSPPIFDTKGWFVLSRDGVKTFDRLGDRNSRIRREESSVLQFKNVSNFTSHGPLGYTDWNCHSNYPILWFLIS